MYHRRKLLEDLPHADTAVWSCIQEGCNGWMRDNFAFDRAPACPLCGSAMESSVKLLPLLENGNGDLKKIPRGIQI